MTTLARTLAALAILVALAVPHLTAPPPAHADLCTACADPDVPEVIRLGTGGGPVRLMARLRR